MLKCGHYNQEKPIESFKRLKTKSDNNTTTKTKTYTVDMNLNQQDTASLDKQIITNLEMLNQENLNQQVTNLDQQAINQQIDKNVAQYIINLISKADKFSWIYYKYDKLKNSTSFTYYCNCREELRNKKPRIDNISN
ncbi:36026_t:CDS:2 [Racocetra persica]|uniref:36026_t:CDS:1 n=1 Tax=Racocetra persica TaxID=160502 RepID=A0ACA9LCN1_9GLOM|nr:36026_t:CDS:2 [Racocetra persica]